MSRSPLVVLLLGLTASMPTLAAPAARTPDARLAAWDRTLDSLRREHRLPGLAAAVVRDRRMIWSKGYGFADEDREVPVTPDTPFWIASVTKTFVGLLFLQLEAAGKVRLDDRIATLPGWDDFCGWLSTSGLAFGRDLRCDAPITLRTILNHTSNGEPGTRFLYNPILYSRLSRYLEFRHGRPIAEAEGRHNTMARLVESQILRPAGMKRTMASQWDREKALVYFDMAAAFGVSGSGELLKRRLPERHLAGGAGIVSTAADLARYDIALASGRLGGPALMAKLFEPARSPAGTVLPYAFGWYVQQHRGERLVWHSGWDEEVGFSALMLRVPERGLSMILLANGDGLRWPNPLDGATVEKSPFAAAFLDLFVFGADSSRRETR